MVKSEFRSRAKYVVSVPTTNIYKEDEPRNSEDRPFVGEIVRERERDKASRSIELQCSCVSQGLKRIDIECEKNARLSFVERGREALDYGKTITIGQCPHRANPAIGNCD